MKDLPPPVTDAGQAPLSGMVTTVTLAYTLAAVGVIQVLALVFFYALEVTKPAPHIFGPISDITSAAWNLLLLPLITGFGTTLLPRIGGRIAYLATAAVTAASAVGSMLLVVRVLPFGVATGVSVTALMIQAAWLFAICRGLRRMPDWASIGRTGQLIGIGTWIGAVLVAISMLFGWGSPAQLVVMVAGLLPGLLAWFGWPVWAFFLARRGSLVSKSSYHRGLS